MIREACENHVGTIRSLFVLVLCVSTFTSEVMTFFSHALLFKRPGENNQ